jgi:hypothetical protein
LEIKDKLSRLFLVVLKSSSLAILTEVVKYAARFERYVVESILYIAPAQNSPAVRCRAKHKRLK